jgi:hypothetical protein
MTIDHILTSLGGLVVGIAATYVTFYLRSALTRREQIAKSLADFYASAATAYYAASDLEPGRRTHKSEEGYLTFYKLFDQHYKEFLSASTVLASLVPPALKEEVLDIEDKWDEINKNGFTAGAEKLWFDTLDNIRDKILASIAYNRFTDPFWKF